MLYKFVYIIIYVPVFHSIYSQKYSLKLSRSVPSEYTSHEYSMNNTLESARRHSFRFASKERVGGTLLVAGTVNCY